MPGASRFLHLVVLALTVGVACGGGDDDAPPDPAGPIHLRLQVGIDRRALGGSADSPCGLVGGDEWVADVLTANRRSLVAEPVVVPCNARFQLIEIVLVEAIDGVPVTVTLPQFIRLELRRRPPAPQGPITIERREWDYGEPDEWEQFTVAVGEECGNGIDDDDDDLVDCADAECLVACNDERCDVMGDEDNDGWSECGDAECAASPACQIVEICGDQGGDNDGDGLDNCQDPDCCTEAACSTSSTCVHEDCTNQMDDDFDGSADCADADCAAGCATLHVSWALTRDGAAVTCGQVGADTVSLALDSPGGADLTRALPCQDGEVSWLVPAATYAVTSELVRPGPATIATAGPTAVTLLPGETTDLPVTLALVTAPPTAVGIARVYHSGGETTDAYAADFVELFNRSATAVDLAAYTLQVRSQSTTWTAIGLAGHTLAPGGFALVQLGRAVPGATPTVPLPAPDVVGEAVNLINPGYSVAVMRGATTIADGACPTDDSDLYGGFGSGCGEAGGWAGGTAPTEAISRSSPCTDTDNNNVDFARETLGATSQVRSSATAATPCP